jgi:hypothetical protein
MSEPALPHHYGAMTIPPGVEIVVAMPMDMAGYIGSLI